MLLLCSSFKHMKRMFRIITIVLIACSLVLFYFYINGNDSLIASNSSYGIQDEPGMTTNDFKKKISNKNKIVLVYFYSDWCMPCVKFAPDILVLENETKSYCEILKINTDDNPKITDSIEINTLPMFVIYKNGNKVWENIGLLTKLQIKSKLELFKPK